MNRESEIQTKAKEREELSVVDTRWSGCFSFHSAGRWDSVRLFTAQSQWPS